METRKTKLGADHPNTLTSMHNLAIAYRDRGKWGDAERLQIQVVRIGKIALGLEHPYTLIYMNQLASTYMNQGRWKEAEKLEVQVMETYRS